jgi:hypothetical protein
MDILNIKNRKALNFFEFQAFQNISGCFVVQIFLTTSVTFTKIHVFFQILDSFIYSFSLILEMFKKFKC